MVRMAPPEHSKANEALIFAGCTQALRGVGKQAAKAIARIGPVPLTALSR